jgi:hypothetical protein
MSDIPEDTILNSDRLIASNPIQAIIFTGVHINRIAYVIFHATTTIIIIIMIIIIVTPWP